MTSNAKSLGTPDPDSLGQTHIEHQEGCHPARACGVPDPITEDDEFEINLMVDPQVSDPRNDEDYDTWDYGTEPVDDHELAEKIAPLVPNEMWDQITDRFARMIVDEMPAKILQRLTGDHYGFEKAEALLKNYYSYEGPVTLIEDSIRYLGSQVVTYELDLMCSNIDSNE